VARARRKPEELHGHIARRRAGLSVTLRANAAPKSRRGFAAQTAEHPRQVFLMGEAARQSDLGNRIVGLGQQAPRAFDAGAHQILMGRAAGGPFEAPGKMGGAEPHGVRHL